jgi:predicted HTH transcriptional regulator
MYLMPSEFIKEKAREISYVLIRVAFYVKRPELGARFESLAFELLDNVARVSVVNNNQAISSALSTISSLDVMVRLAHSIYEIEPVNATIIIRELNSLNSAIRQFGKLDERLPDLESLFSTMPVSNQSQVAAQVSFGNNSEAQTSAEDSSLDAYRSPVSENISLEELSAPSSSDEVRSVSTRENQSANIAVRQSAILEKIKLGNGTGLRLKDLLAAFPDVSERTIRYDLQKLCEGGTIERVGTGGPATYYRLFSQSAN